MANDRNSRDVPQNSTAPSGNYGKSGLESTQMRDRELVKGGAGDKVLGNPDKGGNRSGGQGNVSQQSSVDTNGGAPSRQTSTASDEEGQL